MVHLYFFAGTSTSSALCRLRTRATNTLLFITLASIIVGCESDDDADDLSPEVGTSGIIGYDGSGGAEADTDAGSEPGDDGITLSWKVRPLSERFSDWIDQPGLEGVEVCLIESVDIPCVTTDEEGVFVLSGVPAHSELLLTFAKEGYVPNLVPVRTGTDSINNPVITQPVMIQKNRLDEQYDLLADNLGVDMVWDENKGSIHMIAVDESLYRSPGGLRFTIHPSAGDGGFYWNTDMRIVPDADNLDEDIPVASFINLEKGEYEITWELIEPKEMSCGIMGHSSSAWADPNQNLLIYGLPAAKPNAVRVTVRPGFASGNIVIGCTPGAVEVETGT